MKILVCSDGHPQAENAIRFNMASALLQSKIKAIHAAIQEGR